MKRKIIVGLIILPLLAGGSFTYGHSLVARVALIVRPYRHRALHNMNLAKSHISPWYASITNNIVTDQIEIVTDKIESAFTFTFGRCARAIKSLVYLFVNKPKAGINARKLKLRARYAALVSQSAPIVDIDLSKEEKELEELYKEAQKTLSRRQIKSLQTVITDIETMGLDLSDWAEAFMDRTNTKAFRTFLDELKAKLEQFKNNVVARAYQMQQRERDRNLKKAFGIIYDLLGEMHSRIEVVHDAFLQAERACNRNAVEFAAMIKPVLDHLTSDATFEFFDGKLRKLQDTLSASHEALAKHIQILRAMAKRHHQTTMKQDLSNGMAILGTLRRRLRS